ncbi:putative repeat protein (TIGR02543 family) [Peptoniphilus koenoeneniae]|uniref:Repeat protein (TIGR02543 family) n=1 Tax=Peptoniphilus koenoeneniae TaxID=507751 RepID=A0ABU0AW68_9FIRM|nr:S-layer homology domain-containing protein [Peptoniphilus koenoeneniae]MDQ0275515.1 putative repeat protein (TIGR02543 family) [Peptoniphilus koenoeneniae]
MNKKKILSLVLSFLMIVTVLPFNVFAAETYTVTPTKTEFVSGKADTATITVKKTVDNGTPTEVDKENIQLAVTGDELSAKGNIVTYNGNAVTEDKTVTVTVKLKDDSAFSDQITFKIKAPEKTFKVTFDANGGKSTPAEQTVKENEMAKEPAEKPTKTGYKFTEWQKDGKKFEFTTTPITADTELKAAWEAKDVTIKFDTNGGSSAPAEQTVKFGKTATAPTPPTKSGYTFDGWYKGDTKFDFNAPINEEGTITLTAKWNPIETLKISDVRAYYDYVTGYVTLNGSLVKNAKVNLGGLPAVYTDSDGFFAIYVGDKEGNYGKYDYGYYDSVNDNKYVRYNLPANTYVEARDSSGYRLDYGTSDSSGYINLSWSGSQKAYIYIDAYGYNYNGKYHRGYYYDYLSHDWSTGKTIYAYYDAKTASYTISKSNQVDKFYNGSGYYPGTNYGKTIYPTSIDVSYDGYTITGYTESNIYLSAYYHGRYVGSAYSNSNGYFSISSNEKIYDKYYLSFKTGKDGKLALAPTVTSAEAGSTSIKGTATNGATVKAYDSKGNYLGQAYADRYNKFSMTLNRKLVAGEKIKLVSYEIGYKENSIEYTVKGQVADLYRMAYIAGYPDGKFHPNYKVTRAEAASMFARLINGSNSFGLSQVTKFNDASNAWYSQAINYITAKGLISGYNDGSFRPDTNITRAEFAQMISGFINAGYPGSASANLKDIKGHWAQDAIDKVFGKKVVQGYPDGSFKPDNELTRAEAVTILNAVFGRTTTYSSINTVSNRTQLKEFLDVSSSDWFYYQVLDASNAHASYDTGYGYEAWTLIR